MKKGLTIILLLVGLITTGFGVADLQGAFTWNSFIASELSDFDENTRLTQNAPDEATKDYYAEKAGLALRNATDYKEWANRGFVRGGMITGLGTALLLTGIILRRRKAVAVSS